MKLGMQVGLGSGHNVLDWDPAPHPQKGAEPPPNFRPICCGQMDGRIKIPFDMMDYINVRPKADV